MHETEMSSVVVRVSGVVVTGTLSPCANNSSIEYRKFRTAHMSENRQKGQNGFEVSVRKSGVSKSILDATMMQV